MTFSCPFKRLVPLFIVFLVSLFCMVAPAQADEMAFEIRGYEIIQDNRLADGDIQELLWPYIGYAKTTEDVEEARSVVEKYFQEQGYIRTMVSIPQQSLDDGIVRLEVVETKIGRVKVTGNRYYTKEMLMRELPSIAPGQVLKVEDVERDFGKLSRNPNIKVKMGLAPSRKTGEDTIELKIEDDLPLHGEIKLDNRSSHSTSDLRLNAMIRYDNLWQKKHSISLKAQTSPEDTDEVRVISSSYVMPGFSEVSDLFVFYAVWSDSETATGGELNVVGKGNIFGARYVRPLPGLPGRKRFAHNLTFGVDYKNFDEQINFTDGGEDPIVTPVTYAPLSVNYGASLKDDHGVTLLSLGLSGAIRGLVTEQQEFSEKNYKSRGNYLAMKASLERRHQLSENYHLNLKLEGQLASEPLISNEQYSTGGMGSVHGYKESEASGDNSLYARVKLTGPELVELLSQKKSYTGVPSLLYEYAALQLKEPLEGQERSVELSGLGLAVQGQLREHVKYRLDWGVALSETKNTGSGTHRGYFSLSYEF